MELQLYIKALLEDERVFVVAAARMRTNIEWLATTQGFKLIEFKSRAKLEDIVQSLVVSDEPFGKVVFFTNKLGLAADLHDYVLFNRRTVTVLI